jgi:hypothetical protein
VLRLRRLAVTFIPFALELPSMATTTPPLTPENFRRLLRVEANLADLHNVLAAVQVGLEREQALPFVPEVLALLDRFAADLDKAHPADRLLPRSNPIDANRAASEATIDLSADLDDR